MVDLAQDGNEALEMITAAERKTLPYDLVLMDWKMPAMDGVECVRRLHEERLSHIPAVIMVTAYGREEALSTAETRGVQLKSALTKPVTASTLLEAIGEALGKGFIAETRLREKDDSTAQAMHQLAGSRVLLVEDNEMNQELELELLKSAGMDVALAGNGREALDILAHDSAFDGILMDCQMPVMDGYTATRELRRNPAFQDMPIIAMTANAMSGDKEKVVEAGMNDHIAKPLDVGQMFATLARWIAPKVGVETALRTEPTPPADGGLPDIPGIDQAAGLAVTMGNIKLFTRLLIKFRDSQANFAELFAAARTDADPTTATRCAHTLKGTAGNIGAKGVQALASELEQACKEQAPPATIQALLNQTLAELSPVIVGLAAVGADEETSAGPPAALDMAKVQPLLNRLATQLASIETEASDTVQELLELTQGTSLAGGMKKIARAVAGYDYEIAEAELQSLILPQ